MKKFYLIILALLILQACSNLNVKDLEEKNFPVYGNYCGPKYPPKGYFPLAINKVDSACKKHDHCYEVKGYFNRQCDLEIIADLKTTKTSTPEEKLAKKLIIAYFTKIINVSK